tara:strand:- start:6162 stop:6629 length:468 start_codon:yes stop_codon:yes gene_type:complete
MNDLEKLYIEVELKVTPFEEMGNTASMHVFERGIDCYTNDLYEIVYEHFDHWNYGDEGIDSDLKKLLDDQENTLLCPLSCRDEVSYDDFIEWLRHKQYAKLTRAESHVAEAMEWIEKHCEESGCDNELKTKLVDMQDILKPIQVNLFNITTGGTI